MIVHSDKETWLTKLERIGVLATDNREIVFNNIMHIVDQRMLTEQFNKLDGNKAVGVDGINKNEYGKNLEVNIASLFNRIKEDKYRPKPARIVQIPKEDGSNRPLAIACIEDKVVQAAVSVMLQAIYEPIFLPCSYGFRPAKNAHGALKDLAKQTYRYKEGAIVEIDIRKYFNRIPHKVLRNFLEEKISDRKFLRLLQRMVEAPIIENDVTTANDIGCPQGSKVSPVLANVYLHYVIDVWFKEVCIKHINGGASMVRYADDMVFIFQSEKDAKNFFKVLPKRLNKYGLEMHVDKSQIIKSGQRQAAKAVAKGERLKSYNFLGFTCYWGKALNGKWWRLKYTSRKDRFTAKLKGLKEYLKSNRNSPDKKEVLKKVIQVVKGWTNYHAISDNQRRVDSFIYHSKRAIFTWFNDMGGNKKLNWTKFTRILDRTHFPTKYKTISML